MKIAVIGDALIDRYIYATSTRMSPEDPDCKIYDHHHVTESGGGALNVTANLQNLVMTEPVEFIGIMPKDWSVSPEHKLCVTTKNAIYKTRLMDQQTGKQLLRIDNRSTYAGYDISKFHRNLKNHGQELASFKFIVVSDYLKGTVSQPLIDCLREHCAASTIFVDTKRPDLALWKQLPNCFVKVNQSEYMRSINGSTVNLVVTCGANGALFFPKKDSALYPCVIHGKEASTSRAGVIGAGDAFLAGFVARYTQTLDVDQSMRYADLAARAYVRIPGTNVITAQQIEQEELKESHDNQGLAGRDFWEG